MKQYIAEKINKQANDLNNIENNKLTKQKQKQGNNKE